jgi:hypothetical protein
MARPPEHGGRGGVHGTNQFPPRAPPSREGDSPPLLGAPWASFRDGLWAPNPFYTLRRLATGETVQTTDPGRALISGRWADIGKFKGPVLRGLGARAPYFHNGSAATLSDVVSFYNSRFNMGLTTQQQTDLVAFLRAL